MKIVITGGAGFIGSHLAETLLLENHKVTIIDDLSTGSFENIKQLTVNQNFKFVLESILNKTVMDRIISECDYVYHLAAAVGVEMVVNDPVHTIETNVLGTDIVLKIANRYRKPIVIASTSEIYGRGVSESFKEDDDRLMGAIQNHRWSYACSKSLDEFLALAYFKQKELPVTVCRFFNTIGTKQTGQYGMVVPRFVQKALKNETINVYGDGTQSRSFCNVLDTVRALSIIKENPKTIGEIYNIGNTEEIPILDLALKIIKLTDSRSEIKLIPYNEAYGEGFDDMQRRKPNIDKIFEHIDWKPVFSLDQTLVQVIEYEMKRLIPN